jgi:hypothetical protein
LSNIVFYHSVPNNIPGILWVQNDRWQPLFRGRSVPDWVPALIEDKRSISHSDSFCSHIPQDILDVLLLIKSGIRRTSSLALRMDCELALINSMLEAAINAGLISKNMRLTETGVDALKHQSRKTSVVKWERSLYIPKSWCDDQATFQPPALEDAIPWGQADPVEVIALTGGEAGQVSLEKSDAKAASPPVDVRPQFPSESRKNPDIHGPSDSTKEE